MRMLALASVLLISTAAFAQEAPQTQPQPKAPQAQPERPDCKLATITRPNVTAARISLRFRDTNGRLTDAQLLDQIKFCNSNVRDSGFSDAMIPPTGGVLVSFTATVGPIGSGRVSLPVTLTDGSADFVVCARAADANPPHQKYGTQWSHGLPQEIRVTAFDQYDRAAADHNCTALRTAHQQRQPKR